jgi:transglutaminase-like putative cysteine protease
MSSTNYCNMLFTLAVCALFCLISPPLPAQQYQTNGFAFDVAPLPAWVDWSGLPEKTDKRTGQAVAYRLVDRQINLTTPQEIQFVRMVTQPLTEAGLSEAAEIEINFNPAFEHLVIHKLDLLRDDQHHDRLRPAEIRLIQREENFENSLYDGVVTAVIIVNDVRIRDSIDLAYSIAGSNPVFGDKHFSSFSMGWTTPVDLARIRLLAPADRRLNYRTFNSQINPSTRHLGAQTEYLWAQEHIPAVISEDDAPVWHQPFPAVQITEYPRWEDVVAWAAGLYGNDHQLPPDLRTMLQGWRAEGMDQRKLAARALKFVQDEVRYFGIELGQNSHRPSLPGEVFERRYGDCKDKASLLVAMLDELGIEAYPALVSTDFQRDIDNWLPSPGLFDHVIVTTRLDGQRYWLDGTRNYQQGDIDTLGTPDFERALIVREGETKLSPIEVADSSIAGMEVEEEFTVTDYTGPVQLNVKTTYTGSLAETLREYFATTSPEAITRAYTNYYARLYPFISSVQTVETQSQPDENRFITLESYQVGQFWEAGDDGSYAFTVASAIAPYIKKPETVRRAAPLGISYPVNIRQKSTLIYPEDIDYQVDEPTLEIEDPFISYHRKISYANRRLTISHDYRSHQDAIPPAKLDDYFSSLNKITDSLTYNTWVSVRSDDQKVDTLVNNLLDRLDRLSTN